MAWRQNGNGNNRGEGQRDAPPERPLELTPPGSAERLGSDLTGFRMDRDEDPEARKGRFHRAALLRLGGPTQSDEPRPREGRQGELERWGGGWHGEQPWEPEHRQVMEGGRGPEEAGVPFRRDVGWEANDLTRQSFAESFSARDRADRMASEEARMVDYYRRGGRGQLPQGRGRGHAFTEGTRGLREEGSVPRREGRWEREPLTAQEIMTRSPRSVSRDSSLADAARIMRDENVGVVPVVDVEGRLVGLLTDRDLVVRAFTDARTPEQFRVRDVMTEDVDAVTPETPLPEVIELMGRRQVRRVPVVDREDRLLGIIAMADIANRAERDEELQAALERISARRSFWQRL